MVEVKGRLLCLYTSVRTGQGRDPVNEFSRSDLGTTDNGRRYRVDVTWNFTGVYAVCGSPNERLRVIPPPYTLVGRGGVGV